MYESLRLVLLILTATAATALAMPASGKQPRAAYPKQILGVWEGGYEACKLPGNLDSDQRIEFKPHLLDDYEQHSKPVQVVQVSRTPLAWKITSILYIDENHLSQSEIYVLNTSGRLTIVDQSRTEVYTRCD